jgi:hypothetical protein
MPQSKTTRSSAAKTATRRKAPSAKPAVTRAATSGTAKAPRRAPSAARPASAVDRTTHLSEDVLETVEAGQVAALEAVRTFVETVDRTLTSHGDAPSRRHEVVNSALEMAEQLVHTQYDFIRRVIDSAGMAAQSSDTKESDGGR